MTQTSPPTHPLPRLSIYGAGRLGQSLGHLWHQQQLAHITQVICRTPARAAAAVAFIGSGQPCTPFDPPADCDIWLIACPDAHIAEAASWLRDRAQLSAAQQVFHCAGSLSHQALAAAHPAGLASIHPVHAFATPAHSVKNFTGSCCVAEGQPAALAVLKPLFTAVGGRWLVLPTATASAKALYHAATVTASNHLVSLLAHAQHLASCAGLPAEDAAALLQPLAQQNLHNVFQAGAVQALTGPISRGDLSTVAAHLDALAPQPADQALYRALAQATLALARRQGFCSDTQLAALAHLLEQPGGDAL